MVNDALIKGLRNLMRGDHNVSGDAQRMEQIAWLLFLKVFDDREKEFEVFEKGTYKSPIPLPLKWRTWASPKDGMTGEALIKFIKEDLFPTLANIPIGDKTDPRHSVVRKVMSETSNHMSEGVLLRQVVNRMNELDLTQGADRHAMNDIYEKFLRELQDAGSAGEYYTPRPITNFIVETVAPKLGETVLDPACGTGGFLVGTLERFKQSSKGKADVETYQRTITGWESKPLPHILAVTNMLLHGIDAPINIVRRDSLARPTVDITDDERVDCIVANPPFGGSQKDGTEKNFPKAFQTKETADLFVYLIIQMLKPYGRAGIVMPDGFLFGSGAKSRLKEELMQKCNLHTIIRLPGGEFTPYAAPKVNLLFFDKLGRTAEQGGGGTKEVWFYQLPLPEGVGLNGFTKTMPLRDEHLDPVRKWFSSPKRSGGGLDLKNRKEGPNAWKVSMADIKARDYNLDFKNPNSPATPDQLDPKEILEGIAKTEKEIEKILGEIKKEV